MATELAKAYVQIVPSARGMGSKLSGVMDKEMPSAGKRAGGILGSGLVSKLSGVIAAAGLGKLLSDSLQAGADLQQSIGGIETLFGDSADAVIRNAEQAYKTAGMSANAYMQAVTGFSASLLQGLGGDTAKAADVADMALKDMSDNANKMGTDMESIQNAYQGFAKQNYTMLDNLKLGYGGTKTEMQRLLSDAQKLSGVEYDISNLSDVYEAIHVIQQDMDITGTTAKEASSTFSGSLASMKAAASDLMANLSLGRDIGPSLKALGETVLSFAKDNLLPMLGNILSALPELISTALPMVIDALRDVLGNTDAILDIAFDMVDGLVDAIAENLPWVLDAAIGLLMGLVDGIIQSLPQLAQATGRVVMTLLGGLSDALPDVLDAALRLIRSLVQGLREALPQLLDAGGRVVMDLLKGIFEALPSVFDSALEILTTLVDSIIENLPQIFAMGEDILLTAIDGIRQALPQMLIAAGDAVISMVTGLINNLPQILSAGIDLVVSLIGGIGEALPDIVDAGIQLAANLFDAILQIDWLQLGIDIVSGLIEGIGKMAGALWDAFVAVAESALDAIKKYFGIASPSKVMRDEVGKFLPSGIAVGVEANTKPLEDSMGGLADLTTATLQTELGTASLGTAPAAAPVRGGDTVFHINVYGAQGQDVDELADVLMQKIQFAYAKKEVALR